MTNELFQELLFEEGRRLFRPMPWRDDTRPYYVLVSELMLQQTQVDRVIPKFRAFIERFPDERALASASLADVLILWQGLGYNRRAKFLYMAAQQIVDQGLFPDTYEGLVALPGVGPNTAGAILAYAYNQPAIFIETNVRTVYLYHFFEGSDSVHDNDIHQKLTETIDKEHPREFYWSLMDYGSYLKRQGVGQNHRSKSYKKQSALEGSVRQVRGQIVRVLAIQPMPRAELEEAVHADERFIVALEGLVQDGLVAVRSNMIDLAK